MSRTAEQAAVAAYRRSAKRFAPAPALVRKGNRLVLVVDQERDALVATSSSTAVARRAVRLFEALAGAVDPEARLRLAGEVADRVHDDELVARACEYFRLLNIGDTPRARLAAAFRYAEAAPHAARIRCHRRAA